MLSVFNRLSRANYASGKGNFTLIFWQINSVGSCGLHGHLQERKSYDKRKI